MTRPINIANALCAGDVLIQAAKATVLARPQGTATSSAVTNPTRTVPAMQDKPQFSPRIPEVHAMKNPTTHLTALTAAMGLIFAVGAFAANPDARQALRDAPVTLAMDGAHSMTGHAPPYLNGVDFPAPYCTLSYAQSVDPITRVRGMGINNVSDPTPHASPSLEDFTTVVGQVEKGGLVDIAVQGYTSGQVAEGVKVYIDWNQDGSFDDVTEGYLIGYLLYSTGTDSERAAASIRVPDSARTGETRMRVIKAYDDMANPWSCNEGAARYGQAEDYTLYVGGLESEDIFCSNFKDRHNGACGAPPATDIVHSGPINIAVPRDANGLSVNFLTGELAPDLAISHFNAHQGDPYLVGPGMFFGWGSNAGNAGVAASNDGPYLVLAPGDVIGPASTFTRYSVGTPGAMFDYWDGVNGYLGIRFMNEETGQINYGYVHIITTHRSGFPAMILDYAYDKSGAAITIP